MTNLVFLPPGIPDSSVTGRTPDLSITPPESPLRPRLGAKESSSSKKMMHGAAALALANTEKEAHRRGVTELEVRGGGWQAGLTSIPPRQLPSWADHEQQLGKMEAQGCWSWGRARGCLSLLTHLPEHSPHFGPHTC